MEEVKQFKFRGHRLGSNIPSIYRETHQSLALNHTALSAVGIRMLVEYLCLENNLPKKENLPIKIDKLVAAGKISLDQAEKLKLVKEIGDGAAHRAEFADRSALIDALQIVHNLLESLFNLRIKSKKKDGEVDDEIPFLEPAKSGAGE